MPAIVELLRTLGSPIMDPKYREPIQNKVVNPKPASKPYSALVSWIEAFKLVGVEGKVIKYGNKYREVCECAEIVVKETNELDGRKA